MKVSVEVSLMQEIVNYLQKDQAVVLLNKIMELNKQLKEPDAQQATGAEPK